MNCCCNNRLNPPSGTTRRSSLALGTRRRRCGGIGFPGSVTSVTGDRLAHASLPDATARPGSAPKSRPGRATGTQRGHHRLRTSGNCAGFLKQLSSERSGSPLIVVVGLFPVLRQRGGQEEPWRRLAGQTLSPRRQGALCAGQVWAFAPFLIRSERAGRPACWLSGSCLGRRRPGVAGNEAQRRSWDTGL